MIDLRAHRPQSCSAAGGGPSTAGRWRRCRALIVFGAHPGAGRQPGGRRAHRRSTASTSCATTSCCCRPRCVIMLGVSLLRRAHVRRLSRDRLLSSLAPDRAHARSPASRSRARARWISVGRLLAAALGVRQALLRRRRRLAVRAQQHGQRRIPGNLIAIGALCSSSSPCCMLQPDLGMTVVVSAAWFAQFFLAGLPLLWVGAAGRRRRRRRRRRLFRCSPTCASRIDRFLDPAVGDSYQVDRALEAFMNGGSVRPRPGRGHGEAGAARRPCRFRLRRRRRGVRPASLCLLIVALFAFVVLRGCRAAAAARPTCSSLLAATGLLVAVRPAGRHQHGLDAAPDADQGHDAAVHLLWRLVAAGAGARPWACCWR